MRIVKTIGIVVGMYATALLAEIFVTGMKTDYQGGVTLLVNLGFLAYLSPKVGYRGLDCLFGLIPIYGFIYVVKIAYRIAFLPQRDWSERKG